MSQTATPPTPVKKPSLLRRVLVLAPYVILAMIVAIVLLLDAVDWDRTHFTGDMKPAIKWHAPILHHFFPEKVDVVADKGPTRALVIPGVVPTDFPAYRNVNRDGVVTGPALLRDWTKPPKLLWKKPCGGGYAGFIVVGQLVITIEQRGNSEAVVAYAADTGDEVWVRSWPTKFRELMGGSGPRATPAFYDGDVFALGALGHLVCIEAATGKQKWEADVLSKDNANVQWGMSGSPLVYDDVVVVNPGAQTEVAKGRALVAYDRKDGKIVWQSGDTQAGYSSPMLATLGGKRQILLFDGDGLGGYDAADGNKLWFHPWVNPTQKINVAQPLVLSDDRVFITTAYGVGCVMLRIRQDNGQWPKALSAVWQPTKAMGCKFSSPVAHKGYIYGLDEGVLACVDEKDGHQVWRDGRYGHGQLLRAGDLLVILAENGDLALVEAKPEACHELGKVHVLDGAKTWNYPALANGRVYVRNHEEMVCYDLTASANP